MPDVLVIDDMRVLRDLPDTAVVCRTLMRGSRLLLSRSQAWDTVYLDHDLGYNPNTRENETIRPLVLKVAQRAHDDDPVPVGEFVVITDNPIGREWITSTLENAGYTVRQETPDYDFSRLKEAIEQAFWERKDSGT
jgi:hypothetical protein